jgi:hypothetical protein
MGLLVVPAALHAPAALAVDQQPGQGVAVTGPDHRPAGGGRPAAGQAPLDLSEDVLADDRRVRDLVRPDPGALVIPLQPGLVAERNVLDVQERFGLALLVPLLVAGVAGIEQDGADRALGPGDAGAVPVAARVVPDGLGMPSPVNFSASA